MPVFAEGSKPRRDAINRVRTRTKRTKGAKNDLYNRHLPQNLAKTAPLVGFQSRIARGFEPLARHNLRSSLKSPILKVILAF